MPRSVHSRSEKNIRCILFDFGDTLWTRVRGVAWKSIEDAGNQAALTILRDHLGSETLPSIEPILLGRQIRKALRIQIRWLLFEEPDYEPDFALATVDALQVLGFPRVDMSVAALVFEALRIRIPRSRALYDDVHSTLSELKRRGFALGVVTNRDYGGPPFLEDLQQMGLLEYFEPQHIAVSAELRARKPNSALFLHALNMLNVPPEEAAMVGDALQADVKGARRLNMFAVWKPSPELLKVAQEAKLQAQQAACAQEGQASRPEKEERHQPALEENSADGQKPITGLSVLEKSAASAELISDEELLEFELRSRDIEPGPQGYGELKPDLIIRSLSELLDVFIEVGK
ncbi:HAD family hydrolase [Ktedonosporobacter rubrisoli]|uniref:HAD family hydrolase n=1 Tax=Ktedonosporobacter rubrisoli TaxID=2509675 RepID=UPI0013EEE1FC|nr:HAD family hydrolase [Ktedonosporobacter rubrisoli]